MGDQYTDETMSVLKISFLSALVLELAATISVALIAVSIGLRLVDGKISFIHGLTVLILAPEVYFPLRNAASLFHASADGTEILERLRRVLSTQRPTMEQVERSFANAQQIKWNKWHLDIPGVNKSVIESASVKRGEALFIVGDSGIGKSTFARNLLGENFECGLSIDGLPLGQEHALEFQRHIGWIPRLNFRFRSANYLMVSTVPWEDVMKKAHNFPEDRFERSLLLVRSSVNLFSSSPMNQQRI
jgi:ATP-binding cassette subfamily C protein CydD